MQRELSIWINPEIQEVSYLLGQRMAETLQNAFQAELSGLQ